MKRQYLTLVSRIRDELQEIEQIINRTQAGWEKTVETNDELYLDGVALNLHSFYTALERVFQLIAANIDQASNANRENWHQELLRQMASEIELVRPPVISKETRDMLDEYRGFRHVVRNVYSFHLSKTKIEPLVQKLPQVFKTLKKEIEDFLLFLEIMVKGCENYKHIRRIDQ